MGLFAQICVSDNGKCGIVIPIEVAHLLEHAVTSRKAPTSRANSRDDEIHQTSAEALRNDYR